MRGNSFRYLDSSPALWLPNQEPTQEIERSQGREVDAWIVPLPERILRDKESEMGADHSAVMAEGYSSWL